MAPGATRSTHTIATLMLASCAALSITAPRLHAQSGIHPGYVALGPDATAAGLDAPVSLLISAPVRDVVARIAAQVDLSLAFDDSLPGVNHRVTLRVVAMPARLALARALAGTPLQALVSPSGQIVLVAKPARKMRSASLVGIVRDAETGQVLDGVRVELVGTRFTTYSRDSGTFSLGQIPHDTYTLRASRMGFEPLVKTIVRTTADSQATPLALALGRATLALAEIIVTPGYFGLLQSSLAAPQSLSREQLETIPQIGEDIYRAVSRLPGVSADDFSAKFSVRGGSGDELYVSLDGLELAEPFHLKDIGGAFSIIDIQAL
ncbi:MAG: carboxypeptidase regulatory-like domain-containing protein, partial [Gemmatimonadaceae bacterium]